MQKAEESLKDTNSKSCNIEIFSEYIRVKTKVLSETHANYQTKFFEKQRWHAFIDKQRAEEKMLSVIEKTYGKGCSLVMGDWCITKQMRHFMPTPMIGLKRILQKKFIGYDVDEYLTSKINYKTRKKSENLSLPCRGKVRKLHPILTYKMENGRLGCINRDYNGVNNIRRVVKQYLLDKTRPEDLQRKKCAQPQ